MNSNINEVIRAVLNPFFVFTKRFCTHQKHQKHQKAPKSTKARIRNQAKAQNAVSEQKQKLRLKNIYGEKNNLFAYLRFCACEEKKKKSSYSEMY